MMVLITATIKVNNGNNCPNGYNNDHDGVDDSDRDGKGYSEDNYGNDVSISDGDASDGNDDADDCYRDDNNDHCGDADAADVGDHGDDGYSDDDNNDNLGAGGGDGVTRMVDTISSTISCLVQGAEICTHLAVNTHHNADFPNEEPGSLKLFACSHTAGKPS